MTDRKYICSGAQNKLEEESVGRQTGQLRRPSASSTVRRPSSVACRKEPISSTLDQRNACSSFH